MTQYENSSQSVNKHFSFKTARVYHIKWTKAILQGTSTLVCEIWGSHGKKYEDFSMFWDMTLHSLVSKSPIFWSGMMFHSTFLQHAGNSTRLHDMT
jgi:hypothetical protein